MSSDRRRAYRFAIPSSRQQGELRFGDMRLPVLLYDQSASGFAALSLLPPGVDIGSSGLLRSGDDWYEIRLVYVTPADHLELEKTSTLDEQVQCFRLGLIRLGDTVDPDRKSEAWSWSMMRDNLAFVMPPHSFMVGYGMLFVIMVVILPVIAILLLRNVKGNFIGDESGLQKSIAATAKFDDIDSDWGKLSSGKEGKATLIPRSEDYTIPLGHLANLDEELRRIIPSNPGASVFLLPEVIRQLHITAEQQQQLQQIVGASSQLITDIEGQLNESISPEQYQNLLDIARDNALQSLTDRQRSKWQNISGEKPQNKGVPAAKADK
jgi:hypothetical protein